MMPHCVYKCLMMIGYTTINVVDASLCVQMTQNGGLYNDKCGLHDGCNVKMKISL
jgi:hypothetical protein